MPKENEPITVNVIIDEKIFRKFAVFDTIYRQRRWLSLAAFPVIMLVFACVCFAARSFNAQAGMLGWVLLTVGIGIPAVYLRMFFSSVKTQIKMYNLSEPQEVYSLMLSREPDGVHVTNTHGESAQYEWGVLHGVYRVAGCTYLYAASNKAFLLPDGQAAEEADALWALFADMLPAEKLHDRRGIKKSG